MSEAFLMGRDGFEPSKQVAADLQSVPFGHSGICPCDQHLSSIAHYLHSDKCFITLYYVTVMLLFTPNSVTSNDCSPFKVPLRGRGCNHFMIDTMAHSLTAQCQACV